VAALPRIHSHQPTKKIPEPFSTDANGGLLTVVGIKDIDCGGVVNSGKEGE